MNLDLFITAEAQSMIDKGAAQVFEWSREFIRRSHNEDTYALHYQRGVEAIDKHLCLNIKRAPLLLISQSSQPIIIARDSDFYSAAKIMQMMVVHDEFACIESDAMLTFVMRAHKYQLLSLDDLFRSNGNLPVSGLEIEVEQDSIRSISDLDKINQEAARLLEENGYEEMLNQFNEDHPGPFADMRTREEARSWFLKISAFVKTTLV